jgi:hypothetical protein
MENGKMEFHDTPEEIGTVFPDFNCIDSPPWNKVIL